MIIAENLSEQTQVDLMSSGYVSKFWAKSLFNYQYGGLVVLVTIQFHVST